MVKFRKMLVENKGFTLIELLVVIAVLGILAAIAIPRLTGITDRAREQNLISSGNTIRSTVEMVIAESGSYPSSFSRSDGTLTISADSTIVSSYDVTLDTDYVLKNANNENNDKDSYSITLSDPSENYTVYIKNTGVSTTN